MKSISPEWAPPRLFWKERVSFAGEVALSKPRVWGGKPRPAALCYTQPLVRSESGGYSGQRFQGLPEIRWQQ